MELTLEVIHPPRHNGEPPLSHTFRAAGGIIGRASQCDWILEDPSRVLSGQHAEVHFDQQRYQLIDLSSNGVTRKHDSLRLPKGTPVPIEHGEVYRMGEFEIRARLHAASALPPHALIPDDAFLELDSDSAATSSGDLLDLLSPGSGHPTPSTVNAAVTTEGEHHRIESEHIRLPREAVPPQCTQPASDDLAQQVCQRLGLEGHHEFARHYALQAATLLRVLIGEIRQSLHTQQQLDSQLDCSTEPHPWLCSESPEACLAQLLQRSDDAASLLRSACNRLRAQTLALHQASQHSAERLPLLLAPHQLTTALGALRTDGARWRALCQLYAQQPEQVQQRYHNAFNAAYREQSRILSSLHQHFG